jgi:hypothetical protein
MKSPPQPEIPIPQLPSRLGRFEIKAQLGSGGFGVVDRALDPVLGAENSPRTRNVDAVFATSSQDADQCIE